MEPIPVSELEAALLTNCVNPVQEASRENVAALKKIEDLVINIDTNFTASMNAARGYVERIVAEYKKSTQGSGSSAGAVNKWGERINSKSQQAVDILRSINRRISSGGSLGPRSPVSTSVTIADFPKAMYEKLDAIVEAVKTTSSSKSMISPSPPDSSSPSPGGGGDGGGGRWSLASMTQFAKGVQSATKDFDMMGQVFKGLTDDDVDFAIEMRRIGYQTKGITGDMKEQQALLVDIGKSSHFTGVSKTRLEVAYGKNLRKGFIDQSKSLKVTKEGLRVGNMIGANAEESADLFHQWHVQLGLSTDQSSELGRGIQRIAADTGVTGDALLAVVKSSEKFIKNLRDVGNLTSEGAENIIRMRAEAGKLGIGDQVDRLLAVTSKTSSFFEAGPQEKAFLTMVATRGDRTGGLMNSLTAGTLSNDRQNFSKMAEGGKQVFADFAQEFGITTFDQLSKLTDQQRGFLSMKLKNATGMETTELQRWVKLNEMSGKSWNERIKLLADEENKRGQTEKEKEAIRKQRVKMEKEAGFSYLTKLSETWQAGGDAMSMDAAAAEALKGMGTGAQQDLQQMSGGGTAFEQMAKAGMMAAERLKQESGGKQDFTKQLQDALASKDMTAYRTVVESMSAASAEAGTKEMESTNPVDAMNQSIKEWNDTIRTKMMEYIDLTMSVGTKIKFAGGILNGIAGTLAGIGGALLAAKGAWDWIRGKGNIDKMARMATHRGSIFTHDEHVERALLSQGSATSDILSSLDVGKRKTWRQRVKQSVKSRGWKKTVFRGVKKKLIQTRRIVTKPRRWFSGRKLPGGGRSAGAAVRMKNALQSMTGMGNATQKATAAMSSVGRTGVTATKSLASVGRTGVTAAKSFVGVGKTGLTATKSLLTAGKGLGFFAKSVPILGAVMNAGMGMMEEGDGRGMLEKGALGLLTGGSDRGSMFSGSLGIEAGSAADDAMGILGAAGTGAATGAALGSVVPVIGTAVGAIAGALIGGGAEIYKVFTAEDSKLRKAMSGFTESISNGASAAWGAITETFTGAWILLKEFGQWAWDGITGAFSGAWEKMKGFGSWLWGGVTGAFSGAWDRMKGFGAWLWKWMTYPFRLATEKLLALKDWAYNAIMTPIRNIGASFNAVYDWLQSWSAGLMAKRDTTAKAISDPEERRRRREANPERYGTRPKAVPKAAHGGHVIGSGVAVIHAGETIVPADIQRLKPAPMSNVYEQMMQRFAVGSSGGGDLSKVEEYNRLQLDQLVILHNDLRELIASVRPERSAGSRVARDVAPASYPEPPGSSDYGLWPMGQSVSNAQRQAAYPVG